MLDVRAARLFALLVIIALCMPPSTEGIEADCAVLGWKHMQRVEDATHGQNHYTFGHTVAAHGDWIAVGAVDGNMHKGQVRVYFDSGNGFYEHSRLRDSEGSPMDSFGCAVAFNPLANELIVGAEGKSDRGAAFIFTATGDRGLRQWSAPVPLVPGTPLARNDVWWWGVSRFGRSVAVHGHTAVVGSALHQPGMTGTNIKGSKLFYETLAEEHMDFVPNDYVTVFERNSKGQWTEQDLVTAARNNPRNSFGSALALTDEFLVVGAASRLRVTNVSEGGGFGDNDVGGWLYLFAYNGTQWEEVQEIRPAYCYFIGHTVALSEDNEWLVFGSEWYDRPHNQTALWDHNQYADTWQAEPDSVFVYRRNATATFEYFAELRAPANATGYGAALALGNGTLVVGAPGLRHRGNGTAHRGQAFVYALVDGDWALQQVLQDPMEDAEDYAHPHNHSAHFGTGVAVAKDRVVATTESTDQAALAQNPYLTPGAAQVWRHVRSLVDPAKTSIYCKYTAFTVGVLNLCRISARDALGLPQGDRCNAEGFNVSVPGAVLDPVNPAAQYVSRGEYRVAFRAVTPAPSSAVAATYERAAVGAAPAVSVGPAVWPRNTTFRCNGTAPAGYQVTCDIFATALDGGPAGEEDAGADFAVHIYNVQLPEYYEVVASKVRWLQTGRYQFTFIASTAGQHAVLVRYQGQVVAVPNPQMVQITVPELHHNHTTVDCPRLLAPHKNASCVVTVRGPYAAALGGGPETLPLFNATLTNEGASLPVSEWRWLETGKARFTFKPQTEGGLDVEVAHDWVPLANVFAGPLTIAQTVRKCTLLPLAVKSVDLYVAHFKYQNNATVFNNEASSTSVDQNVLTVCEDIEV